MRQGELDRRFDPNYYHPIYRELIGSLKKNKCLTLGEIVSFSSETWDKVHYYDDKFPYVEISEIDTLTGQIKNVQMIQKNEAPSRARMILRTDDIIISTTRPDRGAISLVYEENNLNIASTGFAVLRNMKIRSIDKTYLYLILRQNFTLSQFAQRSSGGNYPAITTQELRRVLVPILDDEKQKSVINIYNNAILDKISKEKLAQQLLNSIDEYLLSELTIQIPSMNTEDIQSRIFLTNNKDVLQNRFDPFYHQKYFETLYNNIYSSKYKIVRFNDILTTLKSGSRPKGGVSHIANGIFSLGGEHINNECEIDVTSPKFITIDYHELHKHTSTQRNDVLLVKDGATTGKIAIITKREHMNQNINEHVFLMRFKNTNPFYITYLLNTKYYQAIIKRNITGATVTGLTKHVIRQFPLPLPSIENQNRIVEHISKIREEVSSLRSEAKMNLERTQNEIKHIILGND